MGVNSFALVDPTSMSQSEIHVVPGWLTAVGAGMAISGAPPPASISGLPQRWSGSPAWLLDRPVRLDPQGYVEPEDGVQVQSGAYERFSGLIPTSMITEPVPGLWAVAPRLEGAGCPDNVVPCWQWNLVGRITYEEASNIAEPVPTATAPDGVTPSPTPTVEPSPTQTPTEPAIPTPSPIQPSPTASPSPPPGAVPCAESDILFTDHSGIVAACFVMPDEEAFGDDPGSAVNPGGNPSVVQIRWEEVDPRLCSDFTVTLDLFRRNPEPLTSDPRGFFAVADVEATSPIGCFAVIAEPLVHVLELHLNEPVRAAEFEIGTVARPRVDLDQTSLGDFRLSILGKPGSRPLSYSADESIEISAQLTYEGSASVIEYSAGLRPVYFWIEQLDGPLLPPRVVAAPCVGYSLTRGEALAVPYADSAGQELRLSPGTYVVTATASGNFDGCQGEGFGLEASLVVKVADVPGPVAVPLSTASGACFFTALQSGYLVAHSDTGLGIRNGARTSPVLWPPGYSARRERGVAVLVRPDGVIAAREGDVIYFGSYTDDARVVACGQVNIGPPP